jgi:hypothetical protein
MARQRSERRCSGTRRWGDLCFAATAAATEGDLEISLRPHYRASMPRASQKQSPPRNQNRGQKQQVKGGWIPGLMPSGFALTQHSRVHDSAHLTRRSISISIPGMRGTWQEGARKTPGHTCEGLGRVMVVFLIKILAGKSTELKRFFIALSRGNS